MTEAEESCHAIRNSIDILDSRQKVWTLDYNSLRLVEEKELDVIGGCTEAGLRTISEAI